MRQRLTSFLRRACYRGGAFSLLNHWRNRDRLTVVMFHRVLPPDDPRWQGADPEWTMSIDLFAGCLGFFSRHYTVIGLDALLDGAGHPVLPPRPLLITFDDGWADNAEYALPALQRAGLPAVIFIAGEAIGRREAFWQERLIAAWRTRRLQLDDLRKAAAVRGVTLHLPHTSKDGDSGLRAAIASIEAWDLPLREDFLRGLRGLDEPREIPAHMLTPTQLRQLAASGIAIGLHGLSHRPLTQLDPAPELAKTRDCLRGHLQEHASGLRDALSFPHGRYDRDVVAAARSSDMRLMFTSDPVLTPLVAGRPTGDLIGRINLPAAAVSGRRGEFRPDRLASWLITRPAHHLMPQ